MIKVDSKNKNHTIDIVMKVQKGHRLRKLMIILMTLGLRDAEHKLKTRK